MKDFLSAKGLEFTDKNIGVDKSAREELITKYGRMATPTIVIGDRIFLGFRDNREKIEKLLDALHGGMND
ncbi:MAG: glutaredoxin domain-containing protein [Nitrospirota bacterium]